MAVVSDLFRSRWASGNHVGAAKPVCRVFFRAGRFNRRYEPWDDEFGAKIPEESAGHHWQAFWEANLAGSGIFQPWREIPNLRECSIEQGFEENGLNRLALTFDNVLMREKAGIGGIFHAIERGFAAPFKGYVGTPGQSNAQKKNEWFQSLNRNAQIVVWEGYGHDALACTFSGLIDDIDLGSKPDVATLTARDEGQQLVDSRMFGWNISKNLRDPVTFCDRRDADEEKEVGAAGAGDASSTAPGHAPHHASDSNPNTHWQSDGRSAEGFTEWVQIRLPQGRYSSFRIKAQYAGMEMFVGVFARPYSPDHGETGGFGYHAPTRDGEELDEGWVTAGFGDVPGANGGWPYVRRVGSTEGGQFRTYKLDGTYRLGDNSILRVGFRRLQKSGHGDYRAGVTQVQGIARRKNPEANKRKWVLVDDVSDVVRTVLRWAGFKEWAVEDTGTRLKDKLVVNRADHYIDVIRKLQEVTGFVFFMDDNPEDRDFEDWQADTDVGHFSIPTFRSSSALRERNGLAFATGQPKPMKLIRDRDLLTGIAAKVSDEPLAYIIRARGRVADQDEGGRMLGGEETRRKMYVYRPPWWSRLSGLIKHEIYFHPQLRTELDCAAACYLIALHQALASATATVQIPANPEIGLDDHVYLVDESTGLQTRLWVASRSHTWTGGTKGSWTMTLGGSLLDTPDIVEIKKELTAARKNGVPIPPIGQAATNSGYARHA